MADGYGEGGFGSVPYGGGGPSPDLSDINGSFERAGVEPGDADQWDFRSVATGFGSLMAYFGLGAQEDFDWIVGTWYFILELLEQAVFGSAFGAQTVDSFESAWDNGSYSFSRLDIAVGVAEGAEFLGGDGDAESYETWFEAPILNTLLFAIYPAIFGEELTFPFTIYSGKSTLRFQVASHQFDFTLPASTYNSQSDLWLAINNAMTVTLAAEGLPLNAIGVLSSNNKIGFEAGEVSNPVVLLPVLDKAKSAWLTVGFVVGSEAAMRRYHQDDTVYQGAFNDGALDIESFENGYGSMVFGVDWEDPDEADFAAFTFSSGGGITIEYETFTDTEWPDLVDNTI